MKMRHASAPALMALTLWMGGCSPSDTAKAEAEDIKATSELAVAPEPPQAATATPPVVAEAPPQADEWLGRYDAQLDGAEGPLSISRAGSGYHVSVSASGTQGCVIEAGGRGSATGDRMRVTSPYDFGDGMSGTCRINLSQSAGGKLTITSEGCEVLHGASCYLSGEARRVR